MEVENCTSPLKETNNLNANIIGGEKKSSNLEIKNFQINKKQIKVKKLILLSLNQQMNIKKYIFTNWQKEKQKQMLFQDMIEIISK